MGGRLGNWDPELPPAPAGFPGTATLQLEKTEAEYLSFAKNASAGMSLRGNAFITVMQTAELRDLDDPADTRDLPRNRTLLVEAQMGPRSVVVSEIRSQGSLEMLGVQDNEVVQTVSSRNTNSTLMVTVGTVKKSIDTSWPTWL